MVAQAQSDNTIAQTMMPRGAAERRKCLNMDGFKRLIVCINLGSQCKRKVYTDSL